MAEVEIGDPGGRIAVYLDAQGAIDVADAFGHGDQFRAELLAAVDEAYPGFRNTELTEIPGTQPLFDQESADAYFGRGWDA